MSDQRLLRRLYGKLLWLYPRTFRQQFGESMLQTFNDLARQQQQREAAHGWTGFILLTWGGLLMQQVQCLRNAGLCD